MPDYHILVFKECRAWKDEIRTLWKEVGELSCLDKRSTEDGVCEGRKGFMLGMSKGKSGPGNTSVRKLFDERFLDPVLKFLRSNKVGKLKPEALPEVAGG